MYNQDSSEEDEDEDISTLEEMDNNIQQQNGNQKPSTATLPIRALPATRPVNLKSLTQISFMYIDVFQIFLTILFGVHESGVLNK